MLQPWLDDSLKHGVNNVQLMSYFIVAVAKNVIKDRVLGQSDESKHVVINSFFMLTKIK
jgi:hypothetical protein